MRRATSTTSRSRSGNESRRAQRTIKDLKQRGLLDETLVLWGTEFGRTPIAEGKDGRDHNPYGYTVWLAGGGVKGGIAYGATGCAACWPN